MWKLDLYANRVNKCDVASDPEIHELVEMEVRELLEKYDYKGDDCKIVFGSALCALNGTNDDIGKITLIP